MLVDDDGQMTATHRAPVDTEHQTTQSSNRHRQRVVADTEQQPTQTQTQTQSSGRRRAAADADSSRHRHRAAADTEHQPTVQVPCVVCPKNWPKNYSNHLPGKLCGASFVTCCAQQSSIDCLKLSSSAHQLIVSPFNIAPLPVQETVESAPILCPVRKLIRPCVPP
jgi:hypothetical protein